MLSTSEKTFFRYKSSNEYDIIDSEMNEPTESVGEIKPDEDNLVLCKNTFNDEKQFVNHLGCHVIQLSPNHLMSNDPENDKHRTLSHQKIKNKISTATLVVRPFKCYSCGLVFDRISQFDNHRRSVHHQERSQICQICGKGFFRQTDLKTHLNIHLGTNRCMCEVCGRKFNHVSNLIRHSRTHSGVKPYPCTICGKRFTQVNTLARHKAIHKRGNEIMDCCFCYKRYKSENSLKEHMRKLHGFTEKLNSQENERIIKRQHYCKICGESFQFVELLRVHEKTHQNVKMLECKSCDQEFQKTDEIKEHRCGRPNLISTNVIRARKIAEERSVVSLITDKTRMNLSRDNEIVLTQLGGINEDSKEPSSSEETYTPTENSRINRLKNFIDHEIHHKLSQATITSSNNKLAEDKQTKETIVYVTSEQLANMNTEQVVDTANHFLHQHLMEIAAENSLQTEDIDSRDYDRETVVSEMIDNCWKEIDMLDVNESETSEKKDSLTSKNNSQNIIYIHASEKDSLIFLNECGNLIDNVKSDLTPEKGIDVKHDLISTENLSLHSEFVAEQYVKKYSSYLIQNETSKRLLCSSMLHENKNRNFKRQYHKQEINTSSTVRAMRGLKTLNAMNYFSDEDSIENDHLLVETTNPSLTYNMFEDLLKNHADNVNVIVGESSGNHEPTCRVVRTENTEQFCELQVANCSGRSKNSSESDKISTAIVNENLSTTQINAVPESLLKVIQLENGQRILELTRSTLSDKTVQCEEAEDIDQTTANSTFIGTSVSENIDQDESRTKSLSQNKCDKIFYLAQNNKDNLIDFFEIETLGTQEQSGFNLASDEVMENGSQAGFDNLQTLNKNNSLGNNESPIDSENCDELLGLVQSNSLKQNEKSKMESKKAKREKDGPMVRLVQNEDGAQFFELIRGDLEFDETQDFELVETNELDQRQNVQLASNAKGAANLRLESSYTIKNTTKLELDIIRKKKQKNNVKKYNCDVCKKSFSKGYNYRQHIGTHFADQQKFKCEECGTFFAWKSTLNKHIATHRAGGQQKFVCEICPKVYTTLSQVNEHVKRDHLKERNHKCVYCAKAFFKKFDLKIHIRTHTKERPYECRICYKSFHHQSHIIRHERIHSGERPYACNICEKTFTQLGSLKNHRQRHQELKIDILDYQMDEDDPLPQTTL